MKLTNIIIKYPYTPYSIYLRGTAGFGAYDSGPWKRESTLYGFAAGGSWFQPWTRGKVQGLGLRAPGLGFRVSSPSRAATTPASSSVRSVLEIQDFQYEPFPHCRL